MKSADVILHTQTGAIRYPNAATVERADVPDPNLVAWIVQFDPAIHDHLHVYLAACGGEVTLRVNLIRTPRGGHVFEAHIESVKVEKRSKRRETGTAVAAPSAAWFTKGGHA